MAKERRATCIVMSLSYIYDNCAEKPTSWDVLSLGAKAESAFFFKSIASVIGAGKLMVINALFLLLQEKFLIGGRAC